MKRDGKHAEPAIYLLVDKNNSVVVYTAVNVPEAKLIRETHDKDLFDSMIEEGCAAIHDPVKNHVTALGLKKDDSKDS